MDAIPESEGRVGHTVDVKPVRIGELRRISIGGGDPQQDDLIGGDHVSAELHLGSGPPGQPRERRPIPQHLLERRREAGRIRAQRRRGGGTFVEGEDSVAKQRRRGDVAGQQEQPDKADDLLVIEACPVYRRAHERAGQIVGGMRAAVLDVRGR